MLTDEQRAAGWIEHDGGPCPVAPDVFVEPMYLGPDDPAKGVRMIVAPAGRLAWWHDGEDDDIIAYRETAND